MSLKLKPLIKLQKLAIHTCEKCKKVFNNSSDLEEHSCHYDKRFYEHVASAYVSVERIPINKCDSCDQNFKTNTEYLLHKFEHVQANVRKRSAMEIKQTNGHILKSYKCPDCNIKFAARSTLDLHSVVHMPYPHVCYCGVGYYKQKDLKTHIKLVHRNDKAIEEIKSVNNSIATKTQPITEAHKIKKPTLNSVLEQKKKSFKNNDKLKSNKNIGIIKEIEFVKTDDNNYKCPLCSRLFKTRLSVSLHYRIHLNDRVHTCYLCAEVLSTTGSLKLHMKECHNTSKISLCKYCPKAFVSYAHRMRHEQIHLKDKSLSGYYWYKCSYCMKAFSDATTLKAHITRHGNNIIKQSYVCDYCERGFKFKSNLVTHILRGGCGKKRFECDYCHMKFTCKPYIRQHILNVHNM